MHRHRQSRWHLIGSGWPSLPGHSITSSQGGSVTGLYKKLTVIKGKYISFNTMTCFGSLQQKAWKKNKLFDCAMMKTSWCNSVVMVTLRHHARNRLVRTTFTGLRDCCRWWMGYGIWCEWSTPVYVLSLYDLLMTCTVGPETGREAERVHWA